MKKSLFAFLILTTSYFLLTTITHAQELTPPQAYQDYLYVQDEYKKAQVDYQVAREAYLRDKTLKLANLSQEKTSNYLVLRDRLVRAHLTTLRTRLVVAKGLEEDEKRTIYSLIDPEVAWYEDHETVYKAQYPLDDLVRKSDQSRVRWENYTEKLVYEVLFTLNRGEIVYTRDRLDKVRLSLEKKINTIKENGDAVSPVTQRWFSEINTSLESSQVFEDQATQAIKEIRTKKSSRSEKTYDEAVKLLEKSYAQLSQTNEFLKEIINAITTIQ